MGTSSSSLSLSHIHFQSEKKQFFLLSTFWIVVHVTLNSVIKNQSVIGGNHFISSRFVSTLPFRSLLLFHVSSCCASAIVASSSSGLFSLFGFKWLSLLSVTNRCNNVIRHIADDDDDVFNRRTESNRKKKYMRETSE